jgi:hypothetical protein
MKPLTSAFALAATLTTANAAFAQHTRVICEVSGDYGVTWHDSLTVWPGQRVDVRVRLPIIDIPVGQSVSHLSGATYQPCLFGWRADLGDRVVPFSFPGVDSVAVPTTEAAYAGRHVIDGIGVTGRVNPFGAGSQSSTSGTGLLSSVVDANNVLRFAGSKATTPQLNLAWGVATAQPPANLTHINYNFSHDPVVFKYAVVLSAQTTQQRSLSAVVPLEFVYGGFVRWYPTPTASTTLAATVRSEDIVPANIAVRNRCHADLAGNFQPNPANPAEPPRSLPDGSVTIDDLFYFLDQFELGTSLADLDDGSGDAILDGAVTIDDLLFFIRHFESGC